MAAAKQTRSQSLPWGMRKSNFGVALSDISTCSAPMRKPTVQTLARVFHLASGLVISFAIIFTYNSRPVTAKDISSAQDISTRNNYVQYAHSNSSSIIKTKHHQVTKAY
jgi:hypothetical protein